MKRMTRVKWVRKDEKYGLHRRDTAQRNGEIKKRMKRRETKNVKDLALAHVDCLRKEGDVALVINLTSDDMIIQRVIKTKRRVQVSVLMCICECVSV